MIYVTSDLHGYPLGRFLDLLGKANFGHEDFIFVLGDVIDRGNDGITLLQWMMLQDNVQLILGNHEAMMLTCKFLIEEISDSSLRELNPEKMSALSTWMFNGAQPTLTALQDLNRRFPGAAEDILDYLRDAPLYETVSVGDRDFLLVHSGLGNFKPNKPLRDYEEHDLLWYRPAAEDHWFEDVTTIIGHTPVTYFGGVPDRAFHTSTWIDIDTGAAGGGSPMLLRLDDMQEYYME